MKNQKRYRLFSTDCAAAVLLVLVTVIIYSPALHSAFVLDDLKKIVENSAIRHFPDLLPVWDFSKSRFLTYYSLSMNYRLSGLVVESYHVFNLFVHLLNGVLVFVLTSLLFRTPRLKGTSGGACMPWFTAAVFLTHPVQIEAVTYTIQRATSLAALFYLGTLVCYLLWRFSKKRRFFAASFFLTVCAMLTKENSFTLPFAMLLFEFFFFGRETRPRRFWVWLAPFALTMLIIPVIFLLKAAAGTSPYWIPRDTIFISRLEYVFTQLNVLRTYLRLFLLPLNQNFDYDYPLSAGFFEPVTFFSFVFLAGLLLFAFSLRKKFPLVFFGVLWFYLTLIVESGLVPLRDVIYEHRLYLPIFGLTLFAGTLTFHFLKTQARFFAFLLIVTGLLSALTYRRNLVWQDPVRLWQDTMQKSPTKSRPHHNLAFHYSESGRYQQAVKEAERAIELNPDSGDDYLTLGYAYGKLGLTAKELEAYETAYEKGVSSPAKLFNNMGQALLNLGRYDSAVDAMSKAIALYPDFAPFYNNLAFVFDKRGEYDSAIRFSLKSIELDPRFAEAWNQLAISSGKKGNPEQAIQFAEKAVALKPQFADGYNTIAVSYAALGDWENVIAFCKKAIAADADFTLAYLNLAKAYKQKGDLTLAKEFAEQAQKLLRKQS